MRTDCPVLVYKTCESERTVLRLFSCLPPPLEPTQLIVFKLFAFSLLTLAVAHLLLYINYLHLKALVVAHCSL